MKTNENSILIIIKQLAFIYLSYLVLMFIGIPCLLLIVFCISVTSGEGFRLFAINDQNAASLITEWCKYGVESVPFDEIFDELTSSSHGAFAALIGLFSDFDIQVFTSRWGYFAQLIFRDVSVLALAQIFITLFKRFRDWINALIESCFFKVMLFGLNVLFVCTSFFVANCIVFCLEKYIVQPKYTSVLHLIILLTSCAISGLLSAYFKKGRVFLKIIYALLKPGFETVRALCVWLIIGIAPLSYSGEATFSTIYYGIEFSIFIVIVAILFFFIEAAEKLIEKEYD